MQNVCTYGKKFAPIDKLAPSYSWCICAKLAPSLYLKNVAA
jgi:hypothetical protein